MLLLTRLVFLASLCFVAYASIVDDIITAIEQAVDCASCHTLVVLLKGVSILGDNTFSSSLIAVCKALGVSITSA